MPRPKKVKKPSKGFRDGVTKEDILEFTKEEQEQIRKQREFATIKRDSMSYKVALQCDDLRKIRDMTMMNIEKRLLNIKNTKLAINRMQVEVTSGVITREIRNGVKMTADELRLEIETAESMAYATALDIPTDLGKLRTIVGFTDVVKNVVMTEDEYDEYVRNVEKSLATFGYKLFDDKI